MALRLTIVATHPSQYAAPWYRFIAEHCPELDLTVLYASLPDARQQAVDFDAAFQWDTPLLDGYRWSAAQPAAPGADFSAYSFNGLDVPAIGRALLDTEPDVVLIPGWHSRTLVRALLTCRRHRLPVLYRGDTHLGFGPSGWRRPLWHLRTGAVLALYSGCLAVGRRSREYLLAHHVAPSRIHASPHAVDNDFFARAAAAHLTPAARTAVRARVGVDPHDFAVLFAGKLMPRKHALDAVRACARLGPDVSLIVAGSGEEEERVRAEAHRHGLRIAWAGFVNQSRMPEIYAAADCLVMPSAIESWGLAVNEAMATGLPAVVSDGVGCAPDLVRAGESGEVFHAGDVDACASALVRIRERGGREAMAAACHAAAARHSFERASTGLVAACQTVERRRTRVRVIACCGGMVIVSGLERMTFEVLRVVRRHGGVVHCVMNGWENHRIVPMADAIGASWSIGAYRHAFTRMLDPIRQAQSLWDVLVTSAGLLRDARRFRPTHVLVPEWAAVVRNAPALAALRLLGVQIVYRIANAPERGGLYKLLWRWLLPPLVTRFVPNSAFSERRLRETGVPGRKVTLIRNTLSSRAGEVAEDRDIVEKAAARRTILVAGQIAPFKGTHLAIDATLALLAQGCDVQTIVVGEVPIWPETAVAYVNDLRDRVARAGAQDRVRFVGGREDVPGIMRASYVLAAPILQEETFGNVVLEARSAGLPVVTFAKGGLGELVEHGHTGFVCATSDVDGLVEGLRFFLEDAAARNRASAASREAAARRDDPYSEAEFERRWWALFDGETPPTSSQPAVRRAPAVRTMQEKRAR